MTTRTFRVTVDGETFEVEVEELTAQGQAGPSRPGAGYGQQVHTSIPPAAAALPAPPPAGPASVGAAPSGAVSVKPERASRPRPAADGGDRVDAPLPGTIVSVSVAPGQEVKAGQVLLILEAMKMQNEIVAPRAGTIREILVAKGDTVGVGDPMVVLA